MIMKSGGILGNVGNEACQSPCYWEGGCCLEGSMDEKQTVKMSAQWGEADHKV